MPNEKYENHNNHNHNGMQNGKESKDEVAKKRTYRILSNEEVIAGKKTQWNALEITGTIRNLSPSLFNLDFLTSLYLNDNQLSRVPPDICKLTNLLTLDLSCNKLRSLPIELGDLVTLRELYLNNNQLRALPYELGRLFNVKKLGLKGNPLNAEFMSFCNESNGIQKLLTYMLDNLNPVQSMPFERQWIPLCQPDRERPSAVFSVMCYNVLCDKYATRQIYGYCPTWALNWEYRKKGIIEEILTGNADIICLQEVETEQYHSLFHPTLKQHGYESVFSPKSRAKTMDEHDRKFVDGCAIFYRTSKFSLVKEHLVEFNQLAMANAEGCEDMLNRVMTKDNIGLAVLLETREECYGAISALHPELAGIRQRLLVANVHIHWDPEYSDVKLLQMMMFMQELQKVLDEESQSLRPGGSNQSSRGSDDNQLPLILCGDLNSLPESGVLEYLEKGRVSVTHEDFKDIDYKILRMSNNFDNGYITHNFKLARAHLNTPQEFTNFTYDFKGIIDYIFFSKTHIRTLGVLGPVDRELLDQAKIVGCPHTCVASDHFSLLSEFEMPVPMSSTQSQYLQNSSFPIMRH
ncbi:CCR4-NOT transcription complex subunit 6-like [Holothuria leucospilota]|uniref:poly(A)-specific ribonuclease n=1 Tax=Holothuria leucospilota TaxID=206669 RepID=A0A9Q0YL98_HOLLE|nr:CCR4-NOT transcription complex subunit 6-like [Holothuria leucospilota]